MKYKKGQQITLKPINQIVTVVHVTPYHEEGDEYASVTVRTKQNSLVTIPVAIQDDYLTTDPPKKVTKWWPLSRQ